MRPAVPAVLRSPLFAFSFPRDRSDTGPDTDHVMTDQRLSIWILAGINLCTMLGLGLVGPVLPLYAESFGVSYSTVGLLIALFPIVRLFTNLPSGIWGARYGERRVCTAGASLVACGAFISGSAPNFGWLILGQALQGMGSSLLVTNVMSFIIRTTPSERMGKAMSVYHASFSTGVSIGPIVGGLLGGLGGFRLPFLAYGSLAATSAVLTWLFMQDASSEREAPREVGLFRQKDEIKRLFRNFEYVLALLLTMVLFWVRSGARHTTLPLYARDAAGLDTLHTGILLTIIQVTGLIVLWPAGRAVDHSRKAVAVSANLAVALAVISLGWVDTFSGLVLATVFVGIAMGFCGMPPSVIASDVMPATVRGAGLGLFRMAGDIGFIIGPIMSGLTISYLGYPWTFTLLAMAALIAGLLAFRMTETLKPSGSGQKEVDSFAAERAGGIPP